jgi:alkyl sulfatase BDS1-like metallo-beta-lactamase superfamily hydrolase
MDQSLPKLATVVGLGATQQAAIRLTDTIFMSNDVSNAYLVNTSDGHVLINTGTPMGAPRHQAQFAAVATGPLRAIILTQSHPDHFGGVALLRQPGTQVIAQEQFPQIQADYKAIAPYADERTFRLWEPLMGSEMRKMPGYDPFEIDVLVHDTLALTYGATEFHLLATPGGETLDSLVVHLPNEGTVFTGNLFGPAWLNLPNLYTIRGDRIRSATRYIASLERVRALNPALLITGHGDPIHGREVIQTALIRMRDAVRYIHDATIQGMRTGVSMRQLMGEVTLPDHLKVGQLHGKTAWLVRAIWEDYIGWFDYGSTTELYHIPREAVAPDIVALAGAQALTAKAQDHIAAGRPLHALHLTDILLDANPQDRAALAAKRAALQALLDTAGETMSEVMWLRAELLAIDRAMP